MRNHVRLASLVLAAALLSASAASSAPVIGTGNPAGGVPGTTESNWVLSGRDQAFIVNPATPFWVNPATVAGVTAKWISPYLDVLQSLTMTSLGFTCPGNCAADDPDAQSVDQLYTYTLAFDNPGQDLNIKWASDNSAQFFLNDVLLPQAGGGQLSSLFAFSILSTAFQAANTFKVIVTNFNQANGGNPTGLIVDVSAVPLPPAMLLFGSALIGLNWLRRRRPDRKMGSTIRSARA